MLRSVKPLYNIYTLVSIDITSIFPYHFSLYLNRKFVSLFSFFFSLYYFLFFFLFSLYLLGFQTLKNTLWNHPQKPLFLGYFPIKSLYRFYLFLRNILSLYYKVSAQTQCWLLTFYSVTLRNSIRFTLRFHWVAIRFYLISLRVYFKLSLELHL